MENKCCPKCLDIKPYDLFSKDRSRFDGFSCYCKPCAKIVIDKIHQKDPTKRANRAKAWRNRSRDLKNLAARIWSKKNRDKMNANLVAYRSLKFKRTPKWLTPSDWIEIKWAYKIAREMSNSTGNQYHVDHIIPLRGKNVSGLHVPQNLQVITAQENYNKNNKKSVRGVYV